MKLYFLQDLVNSFFFEKQKKKQSFIKFSFKDQQFPLYFDSLVRKMVRLLFHAVAHLYAVHFRQLIDLQLHPHLNSLFLHFILFLITSNIISSDCSTVHTNSSGTQSSSLTTPGQTDARELRTELDTLDVFISIIGKSMATCLWSSMCTKKKSSKSRMKSSTKKNSFVNNREEHVSNL
jgi:hypothetical protein